MIPMIPMMETAAAVCIGAGLLSWSHFPAPLWPYHLGDRIHCCAWLTNTSGVAVPTVPNAAICEHACRYPGCGQGIGGLRGGGLGSEEDQSERCIAFLLSLNSLLQRLW